MAVCYIMCTVCWIICVYPSVLISRLQELWRVFLCGISRSKGHPWFAFAESTCSGPHSQHALDCEPLLLRKASEKAVPHSLLYRCTFAPRCCCQSFAGQAQDLRFAAEPCPESMSGKSINVAGSGKKEADGSIIKVSGPLVVADNMSGTKMFARALLGWSSFG